MLDLIPGGSLTAVGAAVVLVLGAVWRIFAAGKSSERNANRAARAEAKAAAAEERLEMHREATDVERKARDLTDEEARKEARTWSRPR